MGRTSTTTTGHPAEAIFSQRLPSLPTALATTFAQAPDPSMLDVLPALARSYWSHDCATTLADIWRTHQDATPGNPTQILLRHAALLRQSRLLLSRIIAEHVEPAEATAIATVMRELNSKMSVHLTQPPLTPREYVNHYLLFFDGG